MGIYIKGMDRVSDCIYCLFYSHGYCNAKHGRCNSEFGIDADCPIVEVKTPHGRLIDADAVTEKMWQAENESCFYELDDVVSVDDIDNAPTVIEAEVE
jgi:hypothetical protein